MYCLLDLPDILVQQHLFAFDILQPAPRSPYMKRRPPCCLFPKLTPQGIDRLRRFGDVRRYAPGEALFLTGEVAPGMYVLIKGSVRVTRRDQLGHAAPIVERDRVSLSPKSGIVGAAGVR